MSTPSPEDPWEARERQRERWRQAASNPRRRLNFQGSDPEASVPGLESLVSRGDLVVLGLIAVVGILLFGEVPTLAGSLRGQLTWIAALLMMVLFGTARGALDDLRVSWRRGLNPFLLVLVGWTLFEFFRTPDPFRSFAVFELLRVLLGVGAYILCGYYLRSPRQTGFLAAGLIFLGVCLALYDVSLMGSRGGLGERVSLHESAFGTHENAGSLLVLLLPLALSFALSGDVEEKRRLAATVAALVLGVAELLARTRSAWVAGLVALAVLTLLQTKFPNGRLGGANGDFSRRRARRLPDYLLSPMALLLTAVVLFLVIAGAAPRVLSRVVSLQSALQDESLLTRVRMWEGAAKMAAEKPVAGWGLGIFPVIQGRWTHQGVDIPEAVQNGVGHENIAHDFYVEWAADNGLIGLLLYLAVLGLFFFSACRALPRTTSPPQRALLIGAIATAAGAAVDSLASPAYNFQGVSTVFWCILGLGIGSMRSAAREDQPVAPGASAIDPLPGRAYAAVAVLAACGALGVFLLGKLSGKAGAAAGRGRFEIALLRTRAYPVIPGDTMEWIALFHDANGQGEATAPGTIWRLTGPYPDRLERVKVALTDSTLPAPNDQRHALLQVVAPALPGSDMKQLTMHARYQDLEGRWYDAWSVVDLRGGDAAPAARSK